MNTRQLESFLAVTRTLNFTSAAKQLYITQPTLSRQIKELEKEFGVELFVRSKRGISLTAAGEVLANEVKPLLRKLRALQDAMQDNAIGENGHLNIGISGLERHRFTHLLRGFRKQMPGISVNIHWCPNIIAPIDLLRNGELDLAYTLEPEVKTKNDLDYLVAYEEEISLVISEHHPLARRESVSIEDLRNEDFLFFPKNLNPHSIDFLVKQCITKGFEPHFSGFAKTIEDLLISVESELGLTLLSTSMRTVAPPDVRFLPIRDLDLRMRIVIAWKKDTQNPAVSNYIKFISNHLHDTDDIHEEL